MGEFQLLSENFGSKCSLNILRALVVILEILTLQPVPLCDSSPSSLACFFASQLMLFSPAKRCGCEEDYLETIHTANLLYFF